MTTRLPPHSVEAEQGVLGCVLLSPNEAMGHCVANSVGSEAFYDLRHQAIYDTLAAMYEAREGIDVVTLVQKLKDKQLLEQVGGIAYVSTLPDCSISSENLTWYLRILEEQATRRRLISTCTEIIGKSYDFTGENVRELVDESERQVLAVGSGRVKAVTGTVKELVNGAIGDIEEMWNRKGAIGGLATGFSDLDTKTDGMHGGEMIVIAGRPSTGKTSLAMNIAEHVAVAQKLPVGVFSLEMSSRELIKRMIASRARVNLRLISRGFLTERDFPKLTSSAGAIATAPIYLDDTGGLSVGQMRARARRMHQQFGIKLWVIDYLQLLVTAKRTDSREQQVGEISRNIKAMAKELDAPVIALSQLNRELDRDKHRKPRMSDLRESGSIEQDADLVGMLYKPEVQDEEESHESIAVNMLIAKQRNGDANVDVRFIFLKSFTRFEQACKVSEQDLPYND